MSEQTKLALVYHERDPRERPGLRETIETSVGTDQYRKELFYRRLGSSDWIVNWRSPFSRWSNSRRTFQSGGGITHMGKTIADELKEEGAREGAIATRQQTLIRQMKRRFGEVPPGILATIEAMRDVQQLDHWLDQVITAECLDDFN